jgi:hypothetical protein
VEISLGKGNWTLVREEVSDVPRVTILKDLTSVAAEADYLLLVACMGNCLSNVCTARIVYCGAFCWK